MGVSSCGYEYRYNTPHGHRRILQKSGKWLVNEAILLDHDNRLLTKLREEILDELITSTQPQKITGTYYANKIQEFIINLKGRSPCL